MLIYVNLVTLGFSNEQQWLIQQVTSSTFSKRLCRVKFCLDNVHSCCEAHQCLQEMFLLSTLIYILDCIFYIEPASSCYKLRSIQSIEVSKVCSKILLLEENMMYLIVMCLGIDDLKVI